MKPIYVALTVSAIVAFFAVMFFAVHEMNKQTKIDQENRANYRQACQDLVGAEVTIAGAPHTVIRVEFSNWDGHPMFYCVGVAGREVEVSEGLIRSQRNKNMKLER